MYEALSTYNRALDRSSSITFSNYLNGKVNRLKGVTGKRQRHFLFEYSRDRYGRFETNGTSATLTGKLLNESGEGFDLNITYEQVADPGVYRNSGGYAQNDWRFYKITSGTLTSLTQGPEKLRIAERRSHLGWYTIPQTGDTVRNRRKRPGGTITVLLTEFSAIEKGCRGKDCERYKGSIGLELDQVERWPVYGQICACVTYLQPERAPLTPVQNTPAVVPLPASAPLLLAALGVIGGLARRRSKS